MLKVSGYLLSEALYKAVMWVVESYQDFKLESLNHTPQKVLIDNVLDAARVLANLVSEIED